VSCERHVSAPHLSLLARMKASKHKSPSSTLLQFNQMDTGVDRSNNSVSGNWYHQRYVYSLGDDTMGDDGVGDNKVDGEDMGS